MYCIEIFYKKTKYCKKIRRNNINNSTLYRMILLEWWVKSFHMTIFFLG